MIAEYTGRRQPTTKSDATGDWLLSAEFEQREVHHLGVSSGQHVGGVVRGFLALGLLYVVTSAFTLAKCIRDRQEETALVSRSTRPAWTSC
jgi:hypothetical protein